MWALDQWGTQVKMQGGKNSAAGWLVNGESHPARTAPESHALGIEIKPAILLEICPKPK